MPRHIWTVLCDRVITDRESNNVSLINVIEQVNVPEEVSRPLAEGDDETISAEYQHALCTLWIKDNDGMDQFYVRVELKSPAGNRLGGGLSDMVDLGEMPRSRVNFRSRGFPIVGEGIYEFVVEHGPSESGPWIESARVPIDVRFQAN